jgi:hypothetical protein
MMNELDSDSIKDFCEEALEIADQYGAEEGLSFLIGKKFFEVLRDLKEVQNKSKFLTPIEGSPNLTLELDKKRNINLSLTSAQSQSYGDFLGKIESLKSISELFVMEVKETFDATDIEDYLASYPTLGEEALSAFDVDFSSKPMSVNATLNEIRDIFYIEEMKKMFLGFQKDKAL